ncbi:hypothetical protein RF11_05909 [Thelohanellus kitauei]|uniref:Uncharacterized protein n=1 Tax=Thelohanellus kitauei TaxID=669202 RepID=A0A0C2MRD6_THEKT|nr:hypothetical protein RF11_05909 [Thelohanellus kitauei]
MKRLPEAGKLYFEAARLQEPHFWLYEESRDNFKKAASCYRKANYRKELIDCFQKIIDHKIDCAIHWCFKYGYECKYLFRNMEKMKEFYKRGEALRLRHKIPHTCPTTTFDQQEYENNLLRAKEDYERV